MRPMVGESTGSAKPSHGYLYIEVKVALDALHKQSEMDAA